MRPGRSLPPGTVTFLFTDVQGSTRLLRQLGDEYPPLLAEHNRILRESVEGQGGEVVGTEGDAVFAAFASAGRALAAATAAQRALAAASWPDGIDVRVRMGLHAGEAATSGDDYVGLDVHRAARIGAAAHGGQILLSDTVRALVEATLPEGVELVDLGQHRLKDLARSEHLHQATVAGLRAEFPPLRTLDATPNNLPVQLTSFVGRRREVAEAARLLGTTRLLTLTGPGGTGKTRLSLQVAAEVADEYPDGAFFVPLAPIADPALVPTAILQALGLLDTANRPPAERLADHLRERRLLLVLDNFEQVVAAAPLVADLLRESPGLRVVATSRAVLHVSGEQEFPVPPLGLPDPAHLPGPAALSQFEAVALFIERAVAVKPDFQVTNANAPAVAELCARLDGLPLAIELAAARVKLLPPQAMLARLGSRLDLLTSAARDLPARQQTLRGAIAWSHDLLDEAGRQLFARFAVFVDGAALEAVEQVCADPDAGSDVLEGLAGLVDQSLLRQDEADGESRFWMLATIREFALERLVAGGDADAVGERHAAFYRDLAEQSAPELTGARQKEWLDRLDRENGNLRAALGRSIERGAAETALHLGAALWRFWQMRGLLPEGAEWLRQVLALPHADDHLTAKASALEAAGGVAYWRGDVDVAAEYYDRCLDLCRQLGDRHAIANALYNASFPRLVVHADVPRSRALLEEALAIFRELGEREAVARALWGLGNALYFGDEYETARSVLHESVDLLRAMDDRFSLAWALHTLGLVYSRLGDPMAARPLWREALSLFAEAGDISGIAVVVGDFGALAVAMGDGLRAARLAGASSQLAASGGVDLATVIEREEGRDPTFGGLDGATQAQAIAEGRAMTTNEAIAYALEGLPDGRPESAAGASHA
ncbi:MAG: adenylate/guanylate cyclase domain-containing protein [Candidatus Limnocylindrales bacterium]